MNSQDTPAILPRIFPLRGESVMLDSALAILYGVTTSGQDGLRPRARPCSTRIS